MYKILVLLILVNIGYVFSVCSNGICDIPKEGEFTLTWDIVAYKDKNSDDWIPDGETFNYEMYYITKDDDTQIYYVGLGSGIGIFEEGSEDNAKLLWFKIDQDELSAERNTAPIIKKIIIDDGKVYANTMFGSIVIKFDKLDTVDDLENLSISTYEIDSESEKRVIVDMHYLKNKNRLVLLYSDIDLQPDKYNFNYYNMVNGGISVIDPDEWNLVHSHSSSPEWGGYSLTADNERVVACGVSKVIIWNSNTGSFTEKSGMGFTFTSAIYIPSTQRFFLFANGFLLEYTSDFSLIWLSLLKDNPVNVYSSYLYSADGIESLILSTSVSKVYRLDLSNRLQWRSEALDSTSQNVTSVLISDDSSKIYATTSSANNKVYVLSSSDCASLGCNCKSDPFCSFCEETLQCSFKTQCDVIHSNYECPTAEYKTELKGDINGGTEIKVGLSYIDDHYINDYVCVIDGIDTEATISPVTKEITCLTGAVGSAGTRPFSIEIKLSGGGSVKVAENVFEFYDCGALGCSSCSSNEFPECKWTSTSLCSKGLAESEPCSVINDVNPDIAPFDIPTPIDITTNFNFGNYDSSQVKCKFGDVERESSEVDGSKVKCTTPDFSDNPSIKQVDLLITVDSKDVTSSFAFEFYSCTSYVNCNDCLTYRDYCKWGLGGCTPLEGAPPQTFECPKITHTNPAIINADVNEFLLIGENFNSLPDDVYNCKVEGQDGYSTLSATIEGNDIIKCTGNIDGKERSTFVSVSIIAQGQGYEDDLYSNILDVKLFACSKSDTCDTCLISPDPNLPNCNWCKKDGEYECSYSVDGECLTQCPSILKVEPSRYVINEPIEITITLSDTFKRNLRNIDDDDVITAVIYLGDDEYVSDDCDYVDTVTCTFGSSTIATGGTYFLRLKLGDSIYTEGFEYEIFSCDSIDKCYECIAETEKNFCSWLDGSKCQPIGSLGTPIDPCPTIDISVDKQYSVNGDEEISMSLVPEYDELGFNEDSFTCKFVGENSFSSLDTKYEYDVNLAKYIVTCTTPIVSKPGRYDLHLMYNDAIYAIHENIIFYDCNVGDDGHCSDTCLTNNPPYCVYCTQMSKCTASHECLNAPYTITEGTCPSAVLDPPYIPYYDSKTIKVTFDRNVNELESGFECHFTMITSDTSFNGARNFRTDGLAETKDQITSIECLAPSIALPPGRYDAVAMLDIRVELNEDTSTSSLLKGPLPFTWVDCSMEESEADLGPSWCESCNNIRHEYCGFCLSDFKCSVTEECSNSTYFSHETISCPSLFEVVPSVGDPKGGTEVVLKGEGFIDVPNIIILVGANEAEIVSINDTEIVFITPKADEDGDAEVQIYFDSYLYSSDVLLFSYKPSKLSTGVIIAIVLIILAIIVAAIIVLIYMKKKRIGYFKKRLEEPNYAQIAFGKHNDSLLYSVPKDNFKILEGVLLEYDKKFLFAMSRIIPLTDHDKVAKSLIELYHSHSMAKDAIIAMIAEEVKVEKSENTIFRGNSMTAKMFKFYSKLIGIRFLWSKSARLLNELNNIGKERMKEKKKSTDSSGGSSLLTMEMEIDPVRTASGEFTDEDTQANVYQLIVTCQKIFSTLLRSLKEMPVEFREIFCECDKYIRERFGSADSVYKAIGGFIFLRFICPAFTAPQAYGLLESQPNTVTQRQLVLIGKVLQNLANMTIPGHKEAFMVELTSFFEKNIPKMREFYLSILTMPSREEVEEQKLNFPLPIESDDVSSTVKLNALGEIWSVISEIKRFPEKLEEVCDDPEDAKRLTEIYMKMKKKYGKKKRDEDPEAERLVKKKRKDSG